MKIALIGRGKTGGELIKLAEGKHEVRVFSRAEPITKENLVGFDAAIVFVPANAFCDLAETLLASKLPVVSGTTGLDYSALPPPEAPWIVASNFSLGMNMTFLLAKALGALTRIAPAQFHVHEIHHVAKLDAPSGTAISLQGLLPKGTSISSERLGDARGTHILEVTLPGETIRLTHEALDRRVFAEGALFAAENMIKKLPIGIHRFESLLEQRLRQEIAHV